MRAPNITMTKALALFDGVAYTTTGAKNGTAVTTGLPSTDLQSEATPSLSGRALVLFNLTNVTGAAPTLDPVVQGSFDGTNWVTLPVVNEAGAVTAWTQATGTASTHAQARYLVGPLPPFLRGVVTIGGTFSTATVYFKVQASNQR